MFDWCRVRRIVLIASPLTLPVFAAAQSSNMPAAGPPTVSRLRIQVSPVADLHFYVRSLAAGKADSSPPEGFERAVEAARNLDAELKHIFLAWGLVEGSLPDFQSAGALAKAFEALPEAHTFREVIGPSMSFSSTIELRKHAVALGEALAEVEGRFLSTVWPKHKAILDRALEGIQTQLAPKEAACLSDIIERLGIDDPIIYLPVFLITGIPDPGAVTNPWRGGGVSYVGVENFPGTQLYETILHEVTHTLVILGGQSAFQRTFREQLQQLSLSPNDDGVRDVPRAILFIQTGATVRRLIDPAHRDRGETSGYYNGMGRMAVEAIRPAWQRYLDGESTREQAVARLARSLQTTLLTTPPRQPVGPSPGGG